MATARNYGFAMAKWMSKHHPASKLLGPIDYWEALKHEPDKLKIFDTDLEKMKRDGIEPNQQEYWMGYNDFMVRKVKS